MDFTYSNTEKQFVDEVRTWLEEHIVGDFISLQGKGLTGHDDVPAELQIEWEKELAKGGWLGIDFPRSIGGRECSLVEQVLFHKTYVEARAPGRIPPRYPGAITFCFVAVLSPESIGAAV